MKDIGVVLECYCEGLDFFVGYVKDKGYGLCFVVELKLNELCGDILLLIVGYVLVFILMFEYYEMVGVNLEVGYE